MYTMMFSRSSAPVPVPAAHSQQVQVQPLAQSQQAPQPQSDRISPRAPLSAQAQAPYVSSTTETLYPPEVADAIRTSMKNAALMNREGTTALSSGNIRDAVAAFRNALVLMEAISPHVQAAAPGPALQAVPQHRHRMFDDTTPALISVGIPDFKDDYLYIHSKARDFYPDAERELPPAHFKFQVSYYSAVILFNLALCLHKKGTDLDQNHQALVNAIHFYDMAMQSISTIPIEMYYDSLMLLMLAVWSNQSHIYYSLRGYKDAKEIMEGVRNLSARMLLEPQTSLTPEEQKEIYEFVLNVIVMREPSTAACA